MVTVYPQGVIARGPNFYPDISNLPAASLLKTTYVKSLTSSSSLVFPGLLCSSQFDVVHGSGSGSCWKGHGQFRTLHVPQRVASNRWLCRSRDSISPEDEYRSSRNIAISLFRRYRNVIDRGGGDNLKEFIRAGVNAYALGCTDEGLREELSVMKDTGVEIEAIQSYGGTTSVKSKIFANEVDECILWLGLVFITILCTPQPTIVRWSSTPPVSDAMLLEWKGFCALIANAYFVRGMAWLPVKTLQLEQLAVRGRSEEPAVVAGRMRLVFGTLEVVSPQWPKV